MMYVWEIRTRETGANPLNIDFEKLVVLAENFDEAVAKTKKYMKETWTKTALEISSCKKLFEVNLE
jgi:hypothetical protein